MTTTVNIIVGHKVVEVTQLALNGAPTKTVLGVQGETRDFYINTLNQLTIVETEADAEIVEPDAPIEAE